MECYFLRINKLPWSDPEQHEQPETAYLARSISRYTVREIADHFRRSSVTVSEAMTKVEYLLRKDIAFAKGLELLSENLIKGRKRKYRITEACPCYPYYKKEFNMQEPLTHHLPIVADFQIGNTSSTRAHMTSATDSI